MSKENVKKFLEFLQQDPAAVEGMQAAVKGIEDVEKAKAAVIEFAKSKGFEFTAEDLVAVEGETKKELSAEELDEINAAGVTVCCGIGFGNGQKGDYGVGVSCCKWVGAGIGVTFKEIFSRK